MDKIIWSGEITAKPFNGVLDKPKALHKEWILDIQASDCPVELEDEVIKLWEFHMLSNDYSYIKTSVKTLLSDEDAPIAIIQYVREQGLADEETFLIHWWW